MDGHAIPVLTRCKEHSSFGKVIPNSPLQACECGHRNLLYLLPHTRTYTHIAEARIRGEQVEENNSTIENQMQDHWLDLPVLQELSHDHTINTPHDHPCI